LVKEDILFLAGCFAHVCVHTHTQTTPSLHNLTQVMYHNTTNNQMHQVRKERSTSIMGTLFCHSHMSRSNEILPFMPHDCHKKKL